MESQSRQSPDAPNPRFPETLRRVSGDATDPVVGASLIIENTSGHLRVEGHEENPAVRDEREWIAGFKRATDERTVGGMEDQFRSSPDSDDTPVE